MNIEFTAHNIRLDNGTCTKPEMGNTMEAYPRFLAAKRILETVFPGDKRNVRIADVGCLEGGYAVEFARLGFQVLGIEIRETNIAACNYVKANTKLPNLEFVKDNALNIGRYGGFDAVFCCGLLYHLEKPRNFLEILAGVTRKLVILQTHFSVDSSPSAPAATGSPRRWLSKLRKARPVPVEKYVLSDLVENEGLQGRWYIEFNDGESFNQRETSRWASWDNRKSFWIQREYLLQAIRDTGFDLVLEQFDELGPQIAESLLRGYYRTDHRGTFIGIRTGSPPN